MQYIATAIATKGQETIGIFSGMPANLWSYIFHTVLAVFIFIAVIVASFMMKRRKFSGTIFTIAACFICIEGGCWFSIPYFLVALMLFLRKGKEETLPDEKIEADVHDSEDTRGEN